MFVSGLLINECQIFALLISSFLSTLDAAQRFSHMWFPTDKREEDFFVILKSFYVLKTSKSLVSPVRSGEILTKTPECGW